MKHDNYKDGEKMILFITKSRNFLSCKVADLKDSPTAYQLSGHIHLNGNCMTSLSDLEIELKKSDIEVIARYTYKQDDEGGESEEGPQSPIPKHFEKLIENLFGQVNSN